MSERLVDVENANLYLFNMLFRHQAYLEGVKAYFTRTFKRTLTDLYGEFAKYVGQARYDELDGFSRVELQQFVFRFQAAQTHAYNQYTQQLIGLLKDFLSADLEVHTAIYGAVTSRDDSQHSSNPEDLPDEDSLWDTISQTIIPANGLTLKEMFDGFAASSTAKVANRINQGYANSSTSREVLADIIGNHNHSFRDGIFATFANQNNALIATALQHVSSIAQSAVADPLYDKYQWVAILDNKTTEICRDRDGKVYIYGDGPLPPAHYNCRSKAVSLAEGDELHDLPQSFYDWAVTQPDEFLADAFGTVVASRILSDNPVVKNISVTDSVIPLTVDAFRSKIDLITM